MQSERMHVWFDSRCETLEMRTDWIVMWRGPGAVSDDSWDDSSDRYADLGEDSPTDLVFGLWDDDFLGDDASNDTSDDSDNESHFRRLQREADFAALLEQNGYEVDPTIPVMQQFNTKERRQLFYDRPIWYRGESRERNLWIVVGADRQDSVLNEIQRSVGIPNVFVKSRRLDWEGYAMQPCVVFAVRDAMTDLDYALIRQWTSAQEFDVPMRRRVRPRDSEEIRRIEPIALFVVISTQEPSEEENVEYGYPEWRSVFQVVSGSMAILLTLDGLRGRMKSNLDSTWG